MLAEFTNLLISSPEELLESTCRIEKMIRSSKEYRAYIGFLHETHDFNTCIELSQYDFSDEKVELEWHHHPLTLFSLVNIIGNKYLAENPGKDIFSFDIAREVIKAHLDDEISGVMLSKTFHQLYHSGQYEIPKHLVNLGSYKTFLDKYKEYLSEDEVGYYQDILKSKEDIDEQ